MRVVDRAVMAVTLVAVSTPTVTVMRPVVAPEGTVTLSEPGTYTLRVSAEDERPVGPICVVEVEREVTLVACPDDHEHVPSCEH